ncbi:hypothetical protein ACFL16_03480, partial [Patescibacteria group bacterium]
MRNVSAGIIIFFVLIMLGSIIWFEAFHLSGDNKYNEIESSGYQIVEKKHQSRFTYVGGDVQVRNEGNEEWRSVSVGDDLGGNGEVMTLGGTRTVVSFENGIVLRLGNESKLSLATDDQELSMDLELGELLVKSNMNGSRYRLSLGKY